MMDPQASQKTTNQTAQRILDSLRRIVRALRISSRASEKTQGLSAAQIFVMHRLSASPQPLSMNELAEATFTHQSSVSVVVSRLVERGFAERRASQKDARRVEVVLTPAGRAVAAEAPRSVQDELVQAIESLGPERGRELAVLLGELVRHAGYDQGEAKMFDMVD